MAIDKGISGKIRCGVGGEKKGRERRRRESDEGENKGGKERKNHFVVLHSHSHFISPPFYSPSLLFLPSYPLHLPLLRSPHPLRPRAEMARKLNVAFHADTSNHVSLPQAFVREAIHSSKVRAGRSDERGGSEEREKG